jgi:hypothetical protein
VKKESNSSELTGSEGKAFQIIDEAQTDCRRGTATTVEETVGLRGLNES